MVISTPLGSCLKICSHKWKTWLTEMDNFVICYEDTIVYKIIYILVTQLCTKIAS